MEQFLWQIEIKSSKEVQDIVPPTIYKGVKISGVAGRKILIQEKNGRRGQVNRLVYSPDLMPSKKSNYGWDIVLRRPCSKEERKNLLLSLIIFLHIMKKPRSNSPKSLFLKISRR